MAISKDLKNVKWDVRKGHTTYSSIYAPRLVQWILSGGIKKGEVMVWRSGLSGYRKPEELPELTAYFDQWEVKQKPKKKRKAVVHKKKEIKTILIIDDEEDTCNLLKKLLEKRYQVNAFTTGEGGINFVKKHKPDLVLLDLKLGDTDGLTVLSQIKKASPRTIVNMISAYGDENVKKEAKRYGAFGFLDKPLYQKQIFNGIKRVSS